MVMDAKVIAAWLVYTCYPAGQAVSLKQTVLNLVPGIDATTLNSLDAAAATTDNASVLIKVRAIWTGLPSYSPPPCPPNADITTIAGS